MSDTLARDVLVRRMRSQGLRDDTRAATVEDALFRVVGLQAQESRSAALGVRVRSRGLTARSVDEALNDRKSVVRTWCMRGTLHFVAAADVRWLLSVLGPVFIARGRRRLASLGLGNEECDRAVRVIEAALAREGPLTRQELGRIVLEAGIEIDLDGQAPYHLVRRAALSGILCEASKEGESRYALLENVVPVDRGEDRASALARLAYRYLAGYQPASVEDFASWSGLPMRDARSAWASIEDESLIHGGRDRRVLHSADDEIPPATAAARLLPAYDAYLLGYASVRQCVPERGHTQVHPGGGVVRPTVLADGEIAGTWRLEERSGRIRIFIDLFERASVDRAGLREEADDLARFAGVSDVDIRIED